jgi:D-psicose/D-tagatose/L-ribulose 3-epimerase
MAQLGLHTFAIASEWRENVFRERANDLKSQGVAVLEIPLLTPGAIPAEAIRRFAEDQGFAIVNSLGLPTACDVVGDPETALAFLEQSFEDCVRIGSRCLTGVTYGTIGKLSGAPPSQLEIDATARFLERAAKAAAQRHLKLGIEPCNRYETHILNTSQQAIEFVERVGADNLFIHLDTYHMNIEDPGYAEAIETAAPYLGYIHLSESHRGVPGTGTIDWGDVFTALKRIAYSGIATVESMNFTAPEIATGLAIWRPVAARKSDVIDIGLPHLRRAAARAGFKI